MVEASIGPALTALKSNDLSLKIFSFFKQPRAQILLRSLSKKCCLVAARLHNYTPQAADNEKLKRTFAFKNAFKVKIVADVESEESWEIVVKCRQ